jgi:hypothetical protein
MQQGYNQPGTSKVAFRYGLIVGLILAAFESAILLFNTFGTLATANVVLALALSGFGLLAGLAAYGVAGFMASKQTGKVSTGTIAGLWTGTFYGIICFIVSMTLFFGINFPKAMELANNSTSISNIEAYRAGFIIGGVGFAIFGILLAIGLGAGLGALGGLIGKSQAKVLPTPEMPYPSPQQPLYQQAPAYPPQQSVTGQPYPSQLSYPQPPYPGQSYPSQPPQGPYPPQPYSQYPAYGQSDPYQAGEQSNPYR